MTRKSTLLAATLLMLAGCATPMLRPGQLPALTHRAEPAMGVVTSGRITAADIAPLKAAGIREVIDLTQDTETPDFDEAASVRGAGLRYVNLPIAGAKDLTPANVRTFDQLLSRSPRPVLVHCSSSNRVGAMAALRAAWIKGATPEAAIAEGRRWGLKALEPAVREALMQDAAQAH